jgi:class 3 adenylate cyclase/tetratricopeptide (TPR) repeat protein
MASYTPRHLAERILTQRSALEGERKHVTVLFADLAGSTSLAEHADPEEIHQLMDRAFQRMLAEVHRYEGTVNQFTGDGIMALFGAPVALEDAPVQAVRAALGIQRALEPLHREQQAAGGSGFQMRIGIHTGPVVVGRIGDDLRMDYTAVGDTTNLADRLQRLAPAGGIVISEATRRLCAGFFDLAPLGEAQVEGRRESVEAFEVQGERPVRSRVDALAESGLTPLIGRERELADLQLAFAQAREGRGQVVFLAGDAGLGKSRLIHEFRSSLSGQPHIWIEGRCSTYTQTTAFHPVADALRRCFEIEDRDTDQQALEKVDRAVEGLADGLSESLPYLCWLLSLPAGPEIAAMDPISRRSRAVRAAQSLLLRAAERRTLVFVVEDLHWIDTASEDFLGLLADSIPASRALLLFTHRPGYAHPFGDRSFHARIALRTLSADEMSAMTRAILDSDALPEALRRRLTQKAEGNPLFVEEVAKSLLEEGVLIQREGHVELRRGIDDIAIPDRIQDVLMARIDRLESEPKRAIQVASVIGREFALRLLERISELGDRAAHVVDDLRVLELVYEKASHPELAFMFKHQLTRDVAYESVLLQHRKEIHRMVAATIEELYSERLAEHYEALADHFTRGEEWTKAFHYHQLAASKAAGAYANQSAVEHCRKALDLVPKLAERLEPDSLRRLEETLGAAEHALSNFQAAGEAYLRAADLADDVEDRALNLARGSFSLLWAHDFDAAEESAEQALVLGREHDLLVPQTLALVTLDERAVVWHGDFSVSLADEALEIAEKSGDAEALAVALAQVGQKLEMVGDYRRAIEMVRRSIQVARSERLEWLAAFPSWVLGISLTCVGEYDLALKTLREAIDTCERLGDRALKARGLNTLGWCLAEIGAHARASLCNEEGNRLAVEMVELGLVAGAPELHANSAVNLAGNLIALGRPDEALAQLEPIREHLEQSRDPWMRWRYSLHFQDASARRLLASGEPERALALVDDELAGARRHSARKLEARALELRGRTLLHLERHEDAASTLDDALKLGRAIEYSPVVWRALSLRAELARRAGDREAFDRDARQCRELVERLAARLTDSELRTRFGALGEELVVDPLGAYR